MLMRVCLLCVSSLLVGCASSVLNQTMLDVAPKNDSQLAHPNWGEPQNQVVYEEQWQSQTIVETMRYSQQSQFESDLEAYLQEKALSYRVLPGEHIMVHLTEAIHFNTNSTKVSSTSRKWLINLAAFLAQQPNVEVVINGHTDDVGQNLYNDNLSERRAESVKNILMKGNMPSSRLFTRAYGEYLPECSNRTAKGRGCNRRVELVLLVTE